jgi:hypothetical protein
VHHDDEALIADLERRLGGRVMHHVVDQIDYVRDVMIVDVRFQAATRAPDPAANQHVANAQQAVLNQQPAIKPKPAINQQGPINQQPAVHPRPSAGRRPAVRPQPAGGRQIANSGQPADNSRTVIVDRR